MNRFRIGFFKKFFLLLLLAGPVLGQAGAPVGQQVVVVDFDEVFRTTLYGRRIIAEFQQANQVLSDEFERIAEELVAEEKNLSDLRGSFQRHKMCKACLITVRRVHLSAALFAGTFFSRHYCIRWVGSRLFPSIYDMVIIMLYV